MLFHEINSAGGSRRERVISSNWVPVRREGSVFIMQYEAEKEPHRAPVVKGVPRLSRTRINCLAARV